MKERPILFSAPMVRALLGGSKTQTRRAFKDSPPLGVNVAIVNNITLRFGGPGDRLWVREAWRSGKIADQFPPRELTPHVVWYEADGVAPEATNGRLRPGMFMPRWASRITLEVTELRVERLQDIGESDAMAEGGEPILVPPDGGSWPYYEGYRVLWESINGPGSWAANPWVWVVSFKRYWQPGELEDLNAAAYHGGEGDPD